MYLAFGACGIKAISYIGCIKAIEKFIKKEDIEGCIGCSSGSITSLLYILGYNSDELWEIMSKIDIMNYTDDNFERLFNQWGLDDGSKIVRLFSAICKQKCSDIDTLTFNDLYKKTGKELVIVGSNITDSCVEYFNHITTPDMLVLRAMRISISIPYKFVPVKWNGSLYVDGAVYNTYPVNYYIDQGKDVLGFLINDIGKLEPIQNLVQYTIGMLISIEHMLIKNNIKINSENTVYIKSKISAVSFSLTLKQKKKLWKNGYLNTVEHLYNKKNRIKLLKKIFYILIHHQT
jgi:NTE family protein